MSVFKKLKGTFQNAQQDFIDGIRSLTSLENQGRRDSQQSLKAVQVNLDAGADLLKRYQVNWSSIQTETRESARKAEEAASLMNPLFLTWEKHAQSITQLEEESKTIPSILAMLTQLHTLLDGLSESFNAVDKELDLLQDICEEQEFQRRCIEEHRKLAMYKVKKSAEADRVKVELAQAHAKRMAALEAAKKKSLQERADAFTSAFQNDLDFYRVHGHPGRIPTELPKITSLSDIELEQDRQELDSFLGPSGETEGSLGPSGETEGSLGPSGEAEGSLGPSGETEGSLGGSLEVSADGSYIEDDYTADFSVKQDIDFQDDNNYASSAVINQLEINDEDVLILTQEANTFDPLDDNSYKDGCVDANLDQIGKGSTAHSRETSPSNIDPETHEEKQDETRNKTEYLITSSQKPDINVT